MPYLVVIQAGNCRRGCCGAERRPETVGRVTGFAKVIGMQRQCQAAAHVIAECNGAQKSNAIRPLPLGHRQCGGHDPTAGVSKGRRVRIVRLVRVRQHTIGQRGVFRGRHHFGAYDARLPAASERFHVGNRFSAGEQSRPGHHGCNRVENMVFRRLGDVLGEGFAARAHDVRRELVHDR